MCVASTGCVSKNYVRQQVTPIINKVNELDDLTAQNTRAIKETDMQLQSALQQLDYSVTVADQKALSSGKQAEQAQSQADKAARQVQMVQNVVANSDNYRVVGETTVQFQTDRFELSDDATSELDQLAASPGLASGIVVIEGFTDSRGAVDDNYSLSSRRANAVRHYLASHHNLPEYKIYTIGLGADRPIGSNETADGRAKNRRAKVQLMSNSVEGTTTAAIR